jgi:hypothetical protein
MLISDWFLINCLRGAAKHIALLAHRQGFDTADLSDRPRIGIGGSG